MQEWWRHIPGTLDPIAFTIGFFSVYWYALFFLGGFFAILFLSVRLARRGEAPCPEECVSDLLFSVFFGALIGGRIGYALLYNPDAFLASPLMILSPYDFESGRWVGISGMSYHGGLVGTIAVSYWFVRRRGLPFWQTADFLAFLAPIAIFFGRLGNFFNIELYGRITGQPWGMVFPGVAPIGGLRHPSTLYEAFFEGILLFLLLLFFRKKMPFSGVPARNAMRSDAGGLACIFMLLYAAFRFTMEFFRSPDPQLGFFFGAFTLGQLLSFAMFVAAGAMFSWLKRKNRAKMI